MGEDDRINISLKEHFKALLDERSKLSEQRFESMDKALKLAHETTEKTLDALQAAVKTLDKAVGILESRGMTWVAAGGLGVLVLGLILHILRVI